MPIYVYKCESCGSHEEHIQKVSDPPIEHCESCSGPLSKQMTSAAFHLKGGGWYKDLYSSSNGSGADAKPSAGGSTDSTATPSSSSGDAKTDAKPSSSESSKPAASSTSSSNSSSSTS